MSFVSICFTEINFKIYDSRPSTGLRLKPQLRGAPPYLIEVKKHIRHPANHTNNLLLYIYFDHIRFRETWFLFRNKEITVKIVSFNPGHKLRS